jgi:hypothetical protein
MIPDIKAAFSGCLSGSRPRDSLSLGASSRGRGGRRGDAVSADEKRKAPRNSLTYAAAA